MELLQLNKPNKQLILVYFLNLFMGVSYQTYNHLMEQTQHSVVVLDNCTVHHVDEVKALFSEAGVLLLFLPPYSPDLTPIELLFSKIKYYLKQHNDIIPDPGPVITATFNDITSEESSLGKTLWLRSMTIYNSVLTLYRFKIITHTLTCNGMYIFYSLFSCSIIFDF